MNTMPSTVSGQNTMGSELTLLALIEPTDGKQNVVNNNGLLKLQLTVLLHNSPTEGSKIRR